VAAANVTNPVIVLDPLVLRITPLGLLVSPRPLTVIGSVTPDRPPEIANSAPEATDVVPRNNPLSPNAVLLLIATTPVVIVVLPVYVFAADKVKVLVADVFFVNVPEPEMMPDNVWFADDAYTRAPLFEMVAEYEPEFNEPALDTVNVPPEIVVAPENVLTADNVSVPEPDFVNVPVEVAIGSATVVLPAPATVSANSPSTPLPDNTSMVSVLASAWIVAALASVTFPANVLLPEVLLIAPFALAVSPPPLIVIGSVTPVRPPEIISAAPDATDVDDLVVLSSPNALLLVIEIAPALIDVVLV
jgi:hypothetical protein